MKEHCVGGRFRREMEPTGKSKCRVAGAAVLTETSCAQSCVSLPKTYPTTVFTASTVRRSLAHHATQKRGILSDTERGAFVVQAEARCGAAWRRGCEWRWEWLRGCRRWRQRSRQSCTATSSPPTCSWTPPAAPASPTWASRAASRPPGDTPDPPHPQ